MRVCRKCGLNLTLDNFHKDKSKPLGYNYTCKECFKVYYKAWADRNPVTNARHAEWKRTKRNEARLKLVTYLLEHPCVDCGITDIRLLVFDHVTGGKVKGVATMVSQGNNWLKIEAEISKCEVRCWNCHVLVTAQRGGWWTSELGDVTG